MLNIKPEMNGWSASGSHVCTCHKRVTYAASHEVTKSAAINWVGEPSTYQIPWYIRRYIHEFTSMPVLQKGKTGTRSRQGGHRHPKIIVSASKCIKPITQKTDLVHNVSHLGIVWYHIYIITCRDDILLKSGTAVLTDQSQETCPTRSCRLYCSHQKHELDASNPRDTWGIYQSLDR